MSAVFDELGRQIPVTLLEVGPCPVIQVKTEKTDEYSALQLAFDEVRPKVLNKPKLGHLKKAKAGNYRRLREFRNFDGDYKTGDVIKVADLFKTGDMVTVTGVSKGRGFTGVIKRHNFSRPGQTHGTHEAFRGPGSIGQASYPARVWPGKKMPGRMGGVSVTVKNLRIIRIDADKGLMIVKGAVPGASGGWLRISKAR